MRFLLSLIFLPLTVVSQPADENCILLGKITSIINREHFMPKPIDDSLSVYVFDSLIDALDENRNLFTKTEYEAMKAHRFTLDDEIKRGDCTFISEFALNYKSALLRKKAVIENIRAGKLDYSGSDSIKFIKDDLPFDLAEKDLYRVWKKRIAFDILEDISKTGASLDSLKRHFVSIEKAASERIFQNYLCRINGLLNNRNGFDAELGDQFLDIFCTYFDPHSNYFALDAKTSFMSGLSTSSLSLGLELGMNENDEIVVSEIIPGGPAAQSRQLEKDDIITKVTDKDGRDYLVSCTSPETIGEIIFSDSNRNVRLTVRKKNGTELDVALTKQIMKATENSAYSFIAEKGTRVGYIKIPSFYSDFDGESAHGLADDVAIEIARLSNDGIDGLVLDLQGNGGGSMDEAVKLAGLFIKDVPVAIAVGKNGSQHVLKDHNSAMFYDGPVVILVNGNSASASEFFAGAMQDYHRALIAGATTLGKASVQTILPLDEKQQEFVKVTVQKFYRITGESGQIKGIVPDIVMPVLYDGITPREKEFKTALKYDFIKPDVRRIKKYRGDRKGVIAASHLRIKNSRRFNEIKALNLQIDRIYNDPMPPIALKLDDVYQTVDGISRLWKNVKAEIETHSDYKISNTTFEENRISGNALLREINSDKIKDASTNPYLEESIEIIGDWNASEK